MIHQATKLILASLFVAGCLLAAPSTTVLAGDYWGVCCCPPPPPPIEVVLCVKDPCTCCTHEVGVCVPACCAHEVPCVSWRNGIFGRRIATYTWKCCGHSIDIVITKRGRVKVRG